MKCRCHSLGHLGAASVEAFRPGDPDRGDERRRSFLLRCPQCGALYEGAGPERKEGIVRLSASEARELYGDLVPLGRIDLSSPIT